jgi:hypothetical protein
MKAGAISVRPDLGGQQQTFKFQIEFYRIELSLRDAVAVDDDARRPIPNGIVKLHNSLPHNFVRIQNVLAPMFLDLKTEKIHDSFRQSPLTPLRQRTLSERSKLKLSGYTLIEAPWTWKVGSSTFLQFSTRRASSIGVYR